jgi:hypothetical protein
VSSGWAGQACRGAWQAVRMASTASRTMDPEPSSLARLLPVTTATRAGSASGPSASARCLFWRSREGRTQH